MKLLRYGPAGEEKPGILDSRGRIRDLSQVIADLGPAQISPEGLAQLAGVNIDTLPLVEGSPRLGPPVAGIGQFHAIGLNYRNHARESGMAIPAEPILFTKATSCLSGPNDDIVIPRGAQAVDWEVELGVVIGSAAYQISEADALDHVAGYLAANDVSERDFQAKRGGQWVKGKSSPGFGPLGPWLVTKDEIADPQALALKLAVNGEVRQDGHTLRHDFPGGAADRLCQRFPAVDAGGRAHHRHAGRRRHGHEAAGLSEAGRCGHGGGRGLGNPDPAGARAIEERLSAAQDAEGGEILRLRFLRAQFHHGGQRRSRAHLAQQRLQVFAAAADHGLDGAIGAVAHPAGHVEPRGGPAHEFAVADALDAALDDNAQSLRPN